MKGTRAVAAALSAAALVFLAGCGGGKEQEHYRDYTTYAQTQGVPVLTQEQARDIAYAVCDTSPSFAIYTLMLQAGLPVTLDDKSGLGSKEFVALHVAYCDIEAD